MSKDPAGQEQSRSLSPKMVIALVVAVLALIFVLQNSGRGQVTLFFFELSAPAWLWFVGLFLAGLVVGSIFPWFGRSSRKSRG
ncbi:MAG: LapA family protein [Nocardioides sp.]|uniref:LapA family protein n=1 Tax=Nocardioides sp. TaxID=35761 RepID=UPI0039E6FB8F